jgi:hypothetical protein
MKQEPQFGTKEFNDLASQYFGGKQETLEEVARVAFNLGFDNGAKWQQERSYSEEEVRKISLEFFYHWWNTKGSNTEQGFDKWFEQFKKK